jgi:5-methylcytosine-specific restriction endonuclease McrA
MVSVGRSLYRTVKIHRNDYQQLRELQRRYPVQVVVVNGRTYWQFRGKYYWDNDNLSADQVYALLVTREQREQRRIERAQAIVAMDGRQHSPVVRGAIPEDIKQVVWIRDGGRCRYCGSGSELQFDHVIPVAMGGSSSPENLQILCGPCNRRKGAGITAR